MPVKRLLKKCWIRDWKFLSKHAREINPHYQLDDIAEIEVTPRDFGRIAAQTAKQVVTQRIREAERGLDLQRLY